MKTRNTRVGFVFFIVYAVLYGGFVLLNAFSPQTMEITPLAGVNLAILYGFGLIIVALFLALVYGWICQPVESSTALPTESREASSRSSDSSNQGSDA